MMNILISAPYMIKEKEKIIQLLKKYKSLSIDWANVTERLEEKDLLEIIEKYDAIICGDDKITSNILDKAKKLKVIVKWGTGIDSINRQDALKKGINVYNTPNAFTNPVADTTIAMILAFARGLLTNDNLMKDGDWSKPFGFALAEKTIGIIGLGNIGMAVAKRLHSFESTILANDILEKDNTSIKRYGIKMTSKEEIFSSADFITLHCDLNKTSHHIINSDSLDKIKQGTYIINTARGGLIDEPALIKALEDGKIAGAGLDVFQNEPLPKDSPLRRMKNTILSAHNSNSSHYYWQRVHENSIKMLLRGLNIE